MIFSPKQRFNKDTLAADFHAAIADNAAIHYAFETALLEMAAEQPPCCGSMPDVVTAARMEGARKLVSTFLNLTSKGYEPPPADPTELERL